MGRDDRRVKSQAVRLGLPLECRSSSFPVWNRRQTLVKKFKSRKRERETTLGKCCTNQSAADWVRGHPGDQEIRCLNVLKHALEARFVSTPSASHRPPNIATTLRLTGSAGACIVATGILEYGRAGCGKAYVIGSGVSHAFRPICTLVQEVRT